MGSVRRAVAVEIENPPPELYAVEESYRRIVEGVAAYVSERGTLEREKHSELYRRFRELYPWLYSQLIQQAINQGVEAGKSFLEARRDGRVRKPRPEVRRVSIASPRTAEAIRGRPPQPPPLGLSFNSSAGEPNDRDMSCG